MENVYINRMGHRTLIAVEPEVAAQLRAGKKDFSKFKYRREAREAAAA